MKANKTIISIEQRDSALEELYHNRQFYHFIYGEEKFNSTVEQVFAKYLNGHMKNSSWGNDLVIERICWENDNGYLDQ